MRKHLARNIIISVVCFGIVFVGVFFGVQFFTKTGIFRIPGIVIYDESLNADEVALFENIFTEEIDLDKNVTISARNELIAPSLNENEFLYNIKVPITDFYSLDDNITVTSADEALTNSGFRFIDINDLNHTQRLLSINNEYYLDEFNAGAIYRIITFESELYDKEIKPLVADIMTKSFPSKDTVLTFAQTGVTALSRGMNRKLNQVGDAAYFAEYIKDFLSSFDLTHTSNESSFTDYASSENICSDKRFIDTLTVIGLDVVELTGNHNQDCGDVAALETIDTYTANGIKIVGGGKTADEARVPLNISMKDNNFTMLAFNESTGGATYDDTPGANQYDAGIAARQISEAKARGDSVIVDIQYYECNAYASEYEDPTCDAADSAAGDQVGLFRELIDMGADVVVGTSAHQAQTYEVYNNGVIYYGLGNLFFDQIWWPGTTRSLILAHYFYKDKLVQTRIVPTVYDSNMQTRLLDEETSKWWLNRLLSVRP